MTWPRVDRLCRSGTDGSGAGGQRALPVGAVAGVHSIGLIIHGALGGLLFLLWLWVIFDVIATDSVLVRNLPKATWLFFTIFIPVVGVMAWIALGRPEGAGLSVGGQRRLPYGYDPGRTARTRVIGLEDSDQWQPNRTSSRPSSVRDEDDTRAEAPDPDADGDDSAEDGRLR